MVIGLNPGRRRAGQVMVFFIMVLVILCIILLWTFDVHKTLFVKGISQNGGDAAALAAGRWQGITLNLVGSLNVIQALALSAGDSATVGAISNIQARLLYVGPMVAFVASQQAAKNNGIYQNEEFTALLREHAGRVRNDYPTVTGPSGRMLFPEPYPGAWSEYADMLDAIADDGVAAGPDNARFYGDNTGGHILLMTDFYDAIAGRNWCWFYNNAPNLLDTYQDYLSWPPLPPIGYTEYINSEIFGLGLSRVVAGLGNVATREIVEERAADAGIPGSVSDEALAASAVWYCYGSPWGPWAAMSVEGDDPFPAVGPVKPRYDYAGADAAVRVESHTETVTPGIGGGSTSHTIAWTAAAKPFGYLADDARSNSYALVLPAYHDVRLIPVDASSAPLGGSYSIAWRKHIEQHLPDYLSLGPGALSSSCWYCRQITTWEDPQFRQDGVDWLAQYSWRCTVTGGGGGGGTGGGRRRGH